MQPLRLIAGHGQALGPEPSGGPVDDSVLLDAYSRAVVSIVETVNPSAVAIQARDGRGGGTGSGLLITPDGFLLTNHHVVENADAIDATLSDGRAVAADVVGLDAGTDLALLRVRATALPFSALGHSQRVRVGQLVVAIGNPLGFSETVSAGIVSGKKRALRARNGLLIDNVLQHTAPLNPGNSGGPLVTSDNAVIGINTAIIARAQGIGFAVPAETADWVVSEILNHGHVRRAQLGIRAAMRSLSAREARAYGVAQPSVVEVVEVESGSAASRAGLQRKDLVLVLNDELLLSVQDLLRGLSERGALDAVRLIIGRRGQRRAVELKPDRRPHG